MRRASRGVRSWIAIPLLWAFFAGAATADPLSTWPFQGAPRDQGGRFENPSGPVRRAGPLVTVPFLLRRLFARLRDPGGLPERVKPEVDALRRPSRNPSVTSSPIPSGRTGPDPPDSPAASGTSPPASSSRISLESTSS